MSEYLHQVALRIQDEQLARDSMLLPGTDIVFPMQGQDEDQASTLEYPPDTSADSKGGAEHLTITRVVESVENSRSPLPSIAPTYIQSRLIYNQNTEKDSVLQKQFKTEMASPEKEVPAANERKEILLEKLESNTHHTFNSEKSTERITTLQSRKEILREKEIMQPKVVQGKSILPPEPLPPQKIPSVNKLTIGKITVEVVRQVQPQVRTKEKIITRVVSSQDKDTTGTSKLSYGLRQL
ncbi:MAG TPA: hypothetical protein VK589_16175 [Chryseolinea sp.]|nr:hypothetical protein [Chryseolinea sp.]